MAGGAMGAEGVKQTGSGQDQGASTTANSYTPSVTQQQAVSDYYNSLIQPNSVEQNVAQAYQQALGRAPEEAGMSYWANQARTKGLTGQQLAQAIHTGGAPERAVSGFQSQYNPSSFGQQALNRPSYYNTNPVGVDYANIFNPAARSVIQNQQTLTPQQQAQYLGDWSQHYSQSNRAATEAANQARINTANTQWEAYLKDKASREAQAKIDEAVKAKEAEWQQMYASQNSNSNPISPGGKAGGSVPGGLRSLKGLTKP